MAGLSIGLLGLPNVGKTTLFNALTDAEALAANYPFATIEPNSGVVPVPDERLQILTDLYKAKKTIPATVNFEDVAGLVAGASKGEGLGNQFLSHLRSCNAAVQVVRAFENGDITHVSGKVQPEEDIAVINTELVLADLQTIEKRLPKLQKEAKANPKLQPQVDSLQHIKEILDGGTPLWNTEKSDIEKSLLADLFLLTNKPIFYVFNVSEEDLHNDDKKQSLQELVAPNKALFICTKLEEELRKLDENDRQELLLSYGQKQSGLVQLVHAAYASLHLQSFLTAGPKEVRAWTIKKGTTAPQAAGAIHGDFERGFIAANIVDYKDLTYYGSFNQAKTAGKVRTEGKTYIMQPNDVVEFRFNV